MESKVNTSDQPPIRPSANCVQGGLGRRCEALLIEVPPLTANGLFFELQVPSLRVSQPMTTAAMPILLGLRFHVSFSHGCACDPVKVSVCTDRHRFLPDELWGRVGQRLRK